MEHTYKISGMTCNGCKNHVEETLIKIKGIREVSVNLAEHTATLSMEKHIAITTLKKAFEGSSYMIHMQDETIKHIDKSE